MPIKAKLKRMGTRVQSALSSPILKKVALGAGLVGAGALAGYGVAKLLGKKKRRSTTSKLKAKVIKKMLKIKNIQLDRKLLKEQLKGI